jgi:hypothetical protein
MVDIRIQFASRPSDMNDAFGLHRQRQGIGVVDDKSGSWFPCRFRGYVQPSHRLNHPIALPYLAATLARGDSFWGEQCCSD